MKTLLFVAAAMFVAFLAQDASAQIYRDPENRFTFSYPASFGATSPGTNNGFGDRVASVRFSAFSSGMRRGEIVLGGEAALTRGFPMVDLQVAGGLYDALTVEVFPKPLRAVVLKTLRPLTPGNFCQEIAREHHLEADNPGLTTLSAEYRQVVVKMDLMRNVEPKVIRCEVSGDTLTFDKEVTVLASAPRQHLYGAVRFLREPYSTFQLIRGSGHPPSADVLKEMTGVVKSWRAGI